LSEIETFSLFNSVFSRLNSSFFLSNEMRCTITSAVPMLGTSRVGEPRRAAAAPARRLRAPILPSPPSPSRSTTSTLSSSPPPPRSARPLPGVENRGSASRSRVVVLSAASSSSGAAAGESSSGDENDKGSSKPSFLSKLKALFGGGEKLDRERLKALGTGAVASYGAVSNVTYGGGMAVSWVGFVKKFGVSPLASGQWPKFLAFYSAFWMAQNFVRPLRFSLALAMAPAFDRFVDFLAAKLRISRPKAFAVYIALLGITTSTLVFGG